VCVGAGGGGNQKGELHCQARWKIEKETQRDENKTFRDSKGVMLTCVLGVFTSPHPQEMPITTAVCESGESEAQNSYAIYPKFCAPRRWQNWDMDWSRMT
jgi:hypothetical protein